MSGRPPAGVVGVRRVTTRAELEQCWAVRTEVFVLEQHVPAEEEIDALDTAPTTTHVLVEADGVPVGTGRVLSDADHPGEVHLGRIAVLRRARGLGIGARIVVALEGIAVAEHAAADADGRLAVRVELAAQETAVAFYERLGYAVVTGERFLDAGIWHLDMARTIRV